jgi:hypothetical protein
MDILAIVCSLVASISTSLLAQGRGVIRTEFPLEYKDGLIWVQVRFQESPGPLNFLLDSGAGVSVINSRTLQRFNHLRGHRVQVGGVDTTAVGYWPQHLSPAQDSLPLDKQFLAIDLSALSRTCGKTVDGLVGVDFFKTRAVQIDFRASKLRLIPEHRAGTHRTSVPLLVCSGALCLPVSVNHSPQQWVRLDTGCASALHWVHTSDPLENHVSQVCVALAPFEVPIVRTSVLFAGLEFQSVRTAVHHKPIFPHEAGLLGNELLAQFDSLVIDAPAGELVVETNANP